MTRRKMIIVKSIVYQQSKGHRAQRHTLDGCIVNMSEQERGVLDECVSDVLNYRSPLVGRQLGPLTLPSSLTDS